MFRFVYAPALESSLTRVREDATPASSKGFRITMNLLREVFFFFFSEAESQVIKWNMDCRFCGMMYLAAISWKDTNEYQGTMPTYLSCSWLGDNVMIMQVPSVSEPQAVEGSGPGADALMCWWSRGFELSAFDMQNEESRAKLPFKHSLWRVHCRCNWTSQVKSFITAEQVSVAFLFEGIF